MRSWSRPAPVAEEIGEHLLAQPLAPCRDQALHLVVGQQISLREHDQLRQLGEAGAVGAQLATHDLVGVLRRRRPFRRRHLHDVDQRPAALDVREELVAEPGALGRALDQPRDVREHELPIVGLERAEDRIDRREWVVRDLRGRARQPAEQRGLARVRLAHEAGVGQQPQLQLDPAGGPLYPALGEARRLAGGVGEALVAVSPATARGDDRALPRLDQVVALTVEAVDGRARRHEDDLVLPARPVLPGPFAMSPALGAEVRGEPHRRQIAPRRIADEHDIAAAPAVAAVGPTPRHMGLTAKRDDAIAATPALDPDLGPIMKHLLKLADDRGRERTGGWRRSGVRAGRALSEVGGACAAVGEDGSPDRIPVRLPAG